MNLAKLRWRVVSLLAVNNANFVGKEHVFRRLSGEKGKSALRKKVREVMNNVLLVRCRQHLVDLAFSTQFFLPEH